MRKVLFLLLLLSSAATISAQQQDTVISLLDCIDKAMYGNYEIKIATNELAIAKNNVTLVPFLPTISANAAQKQSNTFSNAYNSSADKVKTTTGEDDFSVGASITWTLFDGMKMFATHKIQKELLRQGEFDFRSSVQTLLGEVIGQYYLIISLQSQEKLYEELVKISEIRYNQALTRYMIGSDSGLEYKQAKIYLNSDSTSLLVQREELSNAYIELFRMMNVPFDSKYTIKDTIVQEPVMLVEDLKARMLENNLSLLKIRSGEAVSEQELIIAKSAIIPSLNFSTGYNFYNNESAYVPNKFDQINGFNWGFSLSVPIFSGGENRRKINNARIEREIAALSYSRAEQLLLSQLSQYYNTYLNNIRLIEFEQESTEAAYLNLDAAMEKYRLGALSGIEFREIQTSYLNASANMLNAKYRAKMSELSLHLLSGDMFGR